MASVVARVGLACGLVVSTTASDVSPVQQVLNMMGEMKAKGELAKEQEAKTFAKYAEWVDDEDRRLNQEITTGKAEIEEKSAFVEKAESDIAVLAEEVTALDAEINTMTQDLKASGEQRSTERAAFLEEEQDYAESVDAIERAIQTLKSQNFDRPQQMMMLQQQATGNHAMQRALAALLEVDAKRDDGAPAVAGYESQSGGVIDMLEGLLKKFRRELTTVQREESNKQHAFDMEKLHAGDLLKRDQSDREQKAAIKGETVAASAKAQGEVAQAQSDLQDDQSVLLDLHTTYSGEKAVFEENQKIRAEEIAAIKKAIEIISDPNVAGAHADHIGFTQQPTKHGLSFLQRRSSTAMHAIAQQRVVDLLRSQSKVLSSKVLASAAEQAAANPFEKVIDMIKSLIAKMKEEAAAETAHKEWCDEELKNNKLKRDKRTASVERLSAQVSETEQAIVHMGNKIATLAQEQSDVTGAMGEATTQRHAEKAENENTIADCKTALVAVKQALVVLREFYAKQAAFVQVKQAPQFQAYKGMGESGGGVVGMLEVIESDFQRLETETTAAEYQNAANYDRFMKDSELSKKMKHDMEFKTGMKKDRAEYDLLNMNKDLAVEHEELNRANQYFENLKPSCIDVHVSQEDRVAKRQQEIAALKEAYQILDQK